MTIERKPRAPQRGEVWWADMSTTQAAAFGRDRKLRPVVVLARVPDLMSKRCRCLVVPCTTQSNRQPVPHSVAVEWVAPGGEIRRGSAIAAAVVSLDEGEAMDHRLTTLDALTVRAIGVEVALLARGMAVNERRAA
jgi:mRNA-degrading endonuclease toxin of MazEF toxin-antitoxin module